MTWALLCDMDGTLIDSEPLWHISENRLIESYHKPWTKADGLELTGHTMHRTMEIIIEKTGIDAPVEHLMEQILREQERQLREGIPWFDGAKELLSDLRDRNIPTALVSSSYRQLTDIVCDQAPQGTLSVVVSGDNVTHGKPDPEPYLKAADLCDVPIERCIVVEDSLAGVTSGLNAGAHVVAVGDQFDFSNCNIDDHVDNVGQLSFERLQALVS